MNTNTLAPTPPMTDAQHAAAALWRSVVIGLIGFFTLVDLFAAQAIVPTLAAAYGVSPSAMGFAVNTSTIGMAISGLVVALIGRRINQKAGIWVSLVLLAVPTTLLASAPDLTTFAWLRVLQGIFMAAAFTLTMAYLAEQCSATDTASALAAYITGGVASNLVGRIISGSIADYFGLASNFYAFAALNVAGAVLVLFSIQRTAPMDSVGPAARSALSSWITHLRNPQLRSTFAIGFCILFAFVGTFTYVNFILARDPIALTAMSLGFVYLVFLPSLFTTPVAGRVALKLGTRQTLWGALAVAGAGLPLLLVPSLVWVLVGMALFGVGTFFAQATATGFVGRAALTDRAAASGLYLASYYFGGIAGAAILGQLFDRFGWSACVAGIGVVLLIAAVLARTLALTPTVRPAMAAVT